MSEHCYLCTAEIPDDEAEEFFCHGCKRYICSEHDNPSLGPKHEPAEHDADPEVA